MIKGTLEEEARQLLDALGDDPFLDF